MDQVDRIPVDLVRRVTIGFPPDAEEDGGAAPAGQMLTGDHNLLNVQVQVDYAVRQRSDRDVEDYVVNLDRVEAVLSRTSEAVVAEWIAGRNVDDVLLLGKALLPPVLVEQVQRRIEAYRLGVELRGASVAHLYPRREVRQEFDNVTRAQTAIRTQEHRARQEAAQIVRTAETERREIENRTESYGLGQVQLARAEAESFEKRLLVYHQLRRENPRFLTAVWWDEISRLLARMKEAGRIDLLDNRISGDGLDILTFPPLPKRGGR
jgi:regulator of protease activity HflC (stomatin/prohibitin superfamily)